MICSMLEHVTRVLVVEELEPVVEEQVERLARQVNPAVEILGKEIHLPRGRAGLPGCEKRHRPHAGHPGKGHTAEHCRGEILPPRPPAMCPGCSHRATYYAMRKVFGKKAVYPSDIGCYTMAVGMGTVDTCLCMGASITLASGIMFGGETEGICCSLGDSTFLHGGMTGLLNAAYNKARITVTILDNSTTAMTGHQPHPGTGFTATGEPTVQVSLEALARAWVQVWWRPSTPTTWKRSGELPEGEGVSRAVCSHSPSAMCDQSPQERGPRQGFPGGRGMQGCKICVDFGCPAIEFEGDVAKINDLCTGCGVCATICPSTAIRRWEMRTSECDIVIVGVGGQGVILISDVIGRAGVMAGKPVRGAETHGMAQRGGSVINHTRIGCRFSPLVASGEADVLVALEPAEALRFAYFLSPHGVALVNTRPVLPVTVTTGEARLPPPG